MGCSASKEDDLPLVIRCRERRELVRAAANHRYALAAAHVSYFRSLKEVGDALRKFVDEELITAPSSSSSFSSPSLTLSPSSKKNLGNGAESPLHLHSGDESESHLNLSDSSDEEGDDSEDHNHNHNHGFDGNESRQHNQYGNHAEERARNLNNDDGFYPSRFPHDTYSGYSNGFLSDPFANPNPYPYQYPMPPREPYPDPWNQQGAAAAQSWFFSGNPNVYYMKKSAPAAKTVVQDPPSYGYSDSYWNSPAGYRGNYGYNAAGSPLRMDDREIGRGKPEKEPPPPPSPKVSAWDFFDPFSAAEIGYGSYYSGGEYGYGSNYSSPDSTEVREREGIPELEEETESEVYKEALNGGKLSSAGSSPHSRPVLRDNEKSSRSVPKHRSENGNLRSKLPQRSEFSSSLHRGEDSSRSVPSSKSKGSSRSASLHKIDSSSTSFPSWSSEESEKPSMPPHNEGNHPKPSVASHYGEESVKPSMPTTPHGEGASWVDGETASISLTDEKSSSDHIVVKSVDEGAGKKKGVTFDVEETSKQDGDSSKFSSVTLSSPRGTRDLREVVAEIRDDFETASSYGKEVAMMLEVGMLPYQPSFLKGVIFCLYNSIFLFSTSKSYHINLLNIPS